MVKSFIDNFTKASLSYLNNEMLEDIYNALINDSFGWNYKNLKYDNKRILIKKVKNNGYEIKLKIDNKFIKTIRSWLEFMRAAQKTM